MPLVVCTFFIRKQMKKIYKILILTSLLTHSCSMPKTDITSPNGKICLSFNIDEEGSISYNVTVDNTTFITDSELGFEEFNNLNLKDNFEIINTTTSTKDETWTQIWGENKIIHCHYNEMAVDMVNDDGISLTMRFRIFDDGLGFRYEYKAENADSIIITDELTTFNINGNGMSWSIPANFETYELLYRTLPLNDVDNANTPFTFKTEEEIYASIHEAALTDFPEMTLFKTDENCNTDFHVILAPYPDGIKARFSENSFKTPWRTIQISDEAVGLINSSLILNLNEPSVLKGDLSWIRPMKYIGVWWGMHLGIESWVINDRHGATTENAKRYIDFAADNNIDAVLFEGWNEGWESWGGMQNFDFTKPYSDFDIDEIMQYAKNRNIEVIGHHETGGNIKNYERQLEKAYKWTADKGIHCVKTGYAGGISDGHNHHGQHNVRHYRKVVETAAKHKITLNVHEPIKPTGIRRTYPNMMTREGARGMEWNAWSEGNPPEHHVILPFTRLLAGPMDYTPGTFDILFENTRNSPQRKKWNDNDKGNSRVNTTLAKQLANWVILYSPLQMASDLIEHYEGHPAFQFFRDFNPDCDWSRALQGEPGEYIVVARRADNNYFLGATTNESAREISIPLTFLNENTDYNATIYADGEDAHWKTNPTSYRIEQKILTHNDTLHIRMAAGGGCAVSFIN